ncbi:MULTISPECIES: site-2 protease family protein [Collinsella]|uniref:site-2 protease family protein n=1 Tax=Collinsella TaxID=102106 RepID=UPI000B3733E8|nr:MULTISPECIES: site-2 protease family protein [Collinsella]MBM6906908.1 site-2 protease family protein [Collinsella intestinalis]OUO65312.1 site-2 protease family protein [Collinsella sp. An268]
MLDFSYILYLLMQALAVIVGLCVHESAHALAAWALGDKTARSRGRVSLNPLAHIDPFGTVLLPLIMIVLGGPVFAFAKPVPVYLGNLKHPKRDEVIVSLAGPVSNIVLAVAFALLLHGVAGLSFTPSTARALYAAATFLQLAVLCNLSLAFFNLIPLPPLDGSSLVVPFLSGRALDTYYQIQRYAMPILIIVLYLVPQVLRIDLVGIYFNFTVYPLFDLLTGLALG